MATDGCGVKNRCERVLQRCVDVLEAHRDAELEDTLTALRKSVRMLKQRA